MNSYHRFLDIRDYIPNVNTSLYKTEGIRWPEFHKQLQFEDLNNNKIKPWLHSMGFTSTWIEFFYTPPHDDGVIHSDNVYYADWAKLIFQFGGKGSTMRWWKSDMVMRVSTSAEQVCSTQIPERSEYNIGDRTNDHYHGQVLVTREQYSSIQHEVEVGDCSLVNVGPLHSSYNPTNDKRFTITIALMDKNTSYERRILWDEALEAFKPYLVDSSIDLCGVK
jgi:hypothetical protein